MLVDATDGPKLPYSFQWIGVYGNPTKEGPDRLLMLYAINGLQVSETVSAGAPDPNHYMLPAQLVEHMYPVFSYSIFAGESLKDFPDVLTIEIYQKIPTWDDVTMKRASPLFGLTK